MKYLLQAYSFLIPNHSTINKDQFISIIKSNYSNSRVYEDIKELNKSQAKEFSRLHDIITIGY